MKHDRRRLCLQGLSGLVGLASALGAAPLRAAPVDDFFRAIIGDSYSALLGLFLKGFDPNTRDARGRTGLTLAIYLESWRAAEALLVAPGIDINLANAQGETPLMLAAIKGQVVLARKLIARGADVNKTGWTPLHYAASARMDDNAAMVEVLLEEHAYIDAASPNGSTPLMLAAQYGSERMVQQLIAEGADGTLKNQLGLTAMDFARRAERPHVEGLLRKAWPSLPAPAPRPSGPAAMPSW